MTTFPTFRFIIVCVFMPALMLVAGLLGQKITNKGFLRFLAVVWALSCVIMLLLFGLSKY